MTVAWPRSSDWLSAGVVLLLAAVVYGWIVAGAEVTTGFSDSVSYLVMADFYRAWIRGDDVTGALAHYQSTRFPPLFPLLLGLSGAGVDSQWMAYVVTAACSIGAVAATWWWVRGETGRPTAAAGCAIALALYPGFFLLTIYPASEPIALVLTLVAFALAEKVPRRPSMLLVAALIIGVSPLARMASLALVAAFSVWLVLQRPVPIRQALLSLVAAWSPALAWLGYRAAVPTETYLHEFEYAGFPSTLSALPPWLGEQLRSIVASLNNNWGAARWGFVDWLTAALLPVVVAGAISRLRRGKIDAWYALAYVTLIILWPFPEEMERFVLLLFPVFCLYAIVGLQVIRTMIERRARVSQWRIGGGALMAFFLVAAGPAWVRIAHRAAMPVEPELVPDRLNRPFFELDSDAFALFFLEATTRTRHAAASVADFVGDDDCVYAIRPSVIRSSSHVEAFPYQYPPPDSAEGMAAFPLCEYHFITWSSTRQLKQPPYYPLDELAENVEPLFASYIETEDGQVLVAALLKNKPDENVEGTE